MLARSLTAILCAVATVSAWPIVFYPTKDCHSRPVAVLHEPPAPNHCGFFHEPVRSYSGGTSDNVQKLLIYFNRHVCPADAAHRVYANYTIDNSHNECTPFNKTQTPEAWTFIEEILPIPPINATADVSCNALRVQA